MSWKNALGGKIIEEIIIMWNSWLFNKFAILAAQNQQKTPSQSYDLP